MKRNCLPPFRKSTAGTVKDFFSPSDGCYTIFIPLQEQQEDL